MASLALDDACQQFDANGHIAEEVADGLQVLFGEDFRRCHHTSLIAVVECNEHRHQRHKRLSTAHIALQQAVHLPSRAHIGTNFAHHALLRPREFKR